MVPRSIYVIVLLSLVIAAIHLDAQPVTDADKELIVLLRLGSDHPTPEAVLESINDGDAQIPGGLGEGNPVAGEFAISLRARGPMEAYLESHPEKAAARLQRYMVLEYPNASAIDGILTALANNPHVEHVERNRPIRLHAVPSDPFYPSNGDPEAHQWGPHLMNLEAAWDLIEGHATIGFIDTGVQPGHPDMEPFDDSGLVAVFEGGNYREQLSYDYVHDDCNPDEQEEDTNDRAGHGMHVAGIASALSNNDLGVAGTCWHCPFAMAQVWNQSGVSVDGGLDDSADAVDRFRSQGFQIVSMS